MTIASKTHCPCIFICVYLRPSAVPYLNTQKELLQRILHLYLYRDVIFV